MNLEDDKQPNIQKKLDFSEARTGEAREAGREETESSGARSESESPARTDRIMEEIWEWGNLKEANRRVKANDGSAGIDGLTVDELPDDPQLLAIRDQLLNGTYEPKPVRRVEIRKPDGGMRKLGIPTVLDRVVQQAVMQVLQKQWDRTFSESSYGSGRNDKPIRLWCKRSSISLQVTASWWIWIWRNSSIESTKIS